MNNETYPAGTMHNPPHPGGFLARTYLQPLGLSSRALAARLGVSATTISRIVAGSARVTPEIAVRLEKVLGRSAESWVAMQDQHDLWQARRDVDVSSLHLAPELIAS